MTMMNQDALGRCDFIDVLEEAVVVKKPVAVTLRDGTSFIDEVKDVQTEDGQDWVVFKAHPRVAVAQIEAATRAEPPRPTQH